MGKGILALLIVCLASASAFAAEDPVLPEIVPERIAYVPPSDLLPPGLDADPEALLMSDRTPSWYKYKPAADFGPGSFQRGGIRFFRWKMPALRVEVRAGIEEFTRDPSKLLTEAQESVAYPLLPQGVELFPSEKDGKLNVLLWAGSLLQWYRIIYLTVYFR
jgi:hypothetical protein